MQRENLYKEVLYTITHKLGNAQNSGQGNLANHFLQMQQKKPNALSAALAPLWQTVTSENKSKQPSKDDLLTYAQEAFDIDDETHSKLMEEVKEEKVSNPQKLSDFCRLGGRTNHAAVAVLISHELCKRFLASYCCAQLDCRRG